MLGPHRKKALYISLFSNLGILFFFKYFNFFIESLTAIVGMKLEGQVINVILPVGISFYTFQTMSYTIDCYRGVLKPSYDFVKFLAYVSYFPQLVAGPIERASHLLPQFDLKHVFRSDLFIAGIQLALFGFFKKIVISDNISGVADYYFSQNNLSFIDTVVAVYAFSIQIYCDFSGYTDIARGLAKMMGYDICLNFMFPYYSTNPSDFWRRWHISLSSWLRDYLYIPLGGNRGTTTRTSINLFLTMLLGGLWHGASLNFVLWGTYHGLILIISRVLNFTSHAQEWPNLAPRSLLKMFLYFQVTAFGWLLFRASSWKQIKNMTASLFGFHGFKTTSYENLILVISGALAVGLLDFYLIYRKDLEPWIKWSTPKRLVSYLVAILSIILFGSSLDNEFIYFQF